VIGQTIRIDAQPHTIAGVLPGGVDFPTVPRSGCRWRGIETMRIESEGIARLKPGLTIAKAEEDLPRVHKGMIELAQREQEHFAVGLPTRRLVCRELSPGDNDPAWRGGAQF
jgi:hypothetical protein